MGKRPKVTDCPNRSVKGTPGDLKQTANGSSQKPPAALVSEGDRYIDAPACRKTGLEDGRVLHGVTERVVAAEGPRDRDVVQVQQDRARRRGRARPCRLGRRRRSSAARRGRTGDDRVVVRDVVRERGSGAVDVGHLDGDLVGPVRGVGVSARDLEFGRRGATRLADEGHLPGARVAVAPVDFGAPGRRRVVRDRRGRVGIQERSYDRCEGLVRRRVRNRRLALRGAEGPVGDGGGAAGRSEIDRGEKVVADRHRRRVGAFF